MNTKENRLQGRMFLFFECPAPFVKKLTANLNLLNFIVHILFVMYNKKII